MQPSYISVIFLILFTSKMTKTKPSAPSPLSCREQEGSRAPRHAGCRQGCRLLCVCCQERGFHPALVNAFK